MIRDQQSKTGTVQDSRQDTLWVRSWIQLASKIRCIMWDSEQSSLQNAWCFTSFWMSNNMPSIMSPSSVSHYQQRSAISDQPSATIWDTVAAAAMLLGLLSDWVTEAAPNTSSGGKQSYILSLCPTRWKCYTSHANDHEKLSYRTS